jgi:hypothetical protein
MQELRRPGGSERWTRLVYKNGDDRPCTGQVALTSTCVIRRQRDRSLGFCEPVQTAGPRFWPKARASSLQMLSANEDQRLRDCAFYPKLVSVTVDGSSGLAMGENRSC